jgi:SAM-dependent methyltransferase
MRLVALYPHFDHPAIEERYASWQTQMLLRSDGEVHLQFYDSDEPASYSVAEVEATHVLVVTEPLLVPPPGLAWSLRQTLLTSKAFAAVPLANESSNPKQKFSPEPYLTLRELQEVTEKLRRQPRTSESLKWDQSDPGVYLCSTADLDELESPLRSALVGREVVLSKNDFVHRWSSLRGQTRDDLLSMISNDARSVLEFGCGEGGLGAALKQRQPTRVVGVELDPRAAAVARKRIDDVYTGDVREIVSIIHEQFDWIVGGDILEHLDEPWTFLAELRRISKPDGRLLLSIPNISNVSVVGDLLAGRFDYVYMGLTCVGHLRFFTKRTIGETLAIAGWNVVEILPQNAVTTAAGKQLMESISKAGIPHSAADLTPTGYYVIAQNRG